MAKHLQKDEDLCRGKEKQKKKKKHDYNWALQPYSWDRDVEDEKMHRFWRPDKSVNGFGLCYENAEQQVEEQTVSWSENDRGKKKERKGHKQFVYLYQTGQINKKKSSSNIC